MWVDLLHSPCHNLFLPPPIECQNVVHLNTEHSHLFQQPYLSNAILAPDLEKELLGLIINPTFLNKLICDFPTSPFLSVSDLP